ncbi:hypothetical protein SDC9_71301 [bioreactor metagenome]|uniref:Uncharacterized protein n=1 Tax=bioreactor metagenome TaxID=1076179 RepID=A0A644Y8D4_9ZZZZ
MIPEAMQTETEKQYGPLIFFNAAGDKITVLNEQGFTKLYRSTVR